MAEDSASSLAGQTVLITGAARRIGAALARSFHAAGANLVIHYRNSGEAATSLAAELETARPQSTCLVHGDLRNSATCREVVATAHDAWQRLDILVNNASAFYATPLGSIDDEQFEDLVGSNLRAPLFLSQAAAPSLAHAGGCIINIADIHGQRPRHGYPVYCAAKAGLIMLTRALACELAPGVRVNAIAPGSILWPEDGASDDPATRRAILESTPLGRQGEPEDICAAALYLARDAGFVTGHVLTVDGGRGL